MTYSRSKWLYRVIAWYLVMKHRACAWCTTKTKWRKLLKINKSCWTRAGKTILGHFDVRCLCSRKLWLQEFVQQWQQKMIAAMNGKKVNGPADEKCQNRIKYFIHSGSGSYSVKSLQVGRSVLYCSVDLHFRWNWTIDIRPWYDNSTYVWLAHSEVKWGHTIVKSSLIPDY